MRHGGVQLEKRRRTKHHLRQLRGQVSLMLRFVYITFLTIPPSPPRQLGVSSSFRIQNVWPTIKINKITLCIRANLCERNIDRDDVYVRISQ